MCPLARDVFRSHYAAQSYCSPALVLHPTPQNPHESAKYCFGKQYFVFEFCFDPFELSFDVGPGHQGIGGKKGLGLGYLLYLPHCTYRCTLGMSPFGHGTGK